MKHRALDEVYCSVARTWSVLGDRWTMLVLREAFAGTSRYDRFQTKLEIGRTLLSERLNRLVDEGIFDRIKYSEKPERFEYKLTRKGLDLYPVLLALMEWGDRYKVEDPPVRLFHKACGAEADPHLVCSHCAEPVAYGDLHAEYAPDAW